MFAVTKMTCISLIVVRLDWNLVCGYLNDVIEQVWWLDTFEAGWYDVKTCNLESIKNEENRSDWACSQALKWHVCH